MPATLSSLPPEVVLKILRHLPGPSFGGPRPLEAPSALLATALVSKDFGILSQEVLFESVYLCGKQDVVVWAATEARRATRELRVVLGRSDFHKRRDWLAELMVDAFGKVVEGEEAGLRSLEMSGVPDSRMGEGWTALAGLQGLEALSICGCLSRGVPAPVLSRLKSLRLHTLDNLDPLQVPVFPALTHLCLQVFSNQSPPLGVVCPSLTHFTLSDIVLCVPDPALARDPIRALAPLLPASATHFTITSCLLPGFLDCMPSVTQLTVVSHPMHPAWLLDALQLAAERFAGGGAGVGLDVGAARLERVTVLGADEDELDAEGVESVEALRQAGSQVEFEHMVALPWK